MTKLAIHGGPKAKTVPYASPNRYGDEELAQLTDVIREGRLMVSAGSKVSEFEEAVCEQFGCGFAIANSSGTASVQTALAAVGVSEGDEVITTPMIDAGVPVAILSQNAIPIFADIDIRHGLTDPASAEKLITPRTRAILLVHLGGNIADLDAFMAIGEKHNVAIVEDCSQSHAGRWKGSYVGMIGAIGAFSMNESKHMSTGDGGFCTTSDPEVARIARLFVDKTYIRDGSITGAQPLPFKGMNYRPNCLSAAVALAQLHKVEANVNRRREIVARYFDELADLPHLELPTVLDGAEPAYWPIYTRYTGSEPTRDEIVAALSAEGIPIATSIGPARNVLRSDLIRTKHYYPCTDVVPAFWRDTVYDADSCPSVDALTRTLMTLPVDYRYTDQDVTETIAAVRKVWAHYFG